MYISQAENFSKIPGSPVAYWVSNEMLLHFSNKNFLFYNDVAFVSGNKTSKNDVFLKLRWEISDKDINCRYFTCAKGGNFRKWYGNIDFVIDWSDEARDFYKHYGNLLEKNVVFKAGITYTDLTTKGFNARVMDEQTIPDMAGPALISEERKNKYLIAFFNSIVATRYFQLFNSTLHYKLNDVKRVPIVFDTAEDKLIVAYAEKCIELSKSDWDSFETSWDFKKHPLI